MALTPQQTENISCGRGHVRPAAANDASRKLAMHAVVIHLVGMAKQSNKTFRDKQIVIRLATPLQRELELAAERDGRPVSALARRILVDWMADKVVEREQDEGAQYVQAH
jgi:hypothetical protein